MGHQSPSNFKTTTSLQNPIIHCAHGRAFKGAFQWSLSAHGVMDHIMWACPSYQTFACKWPLITSNPMSNQWQACVWQQNSPGSNKVSGIYVADAILSSEMTVFYLHVMCTLHALLSLSLLFLSWICLLVTQVFMCDWWLTSEAESRPILCEERHRSQRLIWTLSKSSWRWNTDPKAAMFCDVWSLRAGHGDLWAQSVSVCVCYEPPVRVCAY